MFCIGVDEFKDSVCVLGREKYTIEEWRQRGAINGQCHHQLLRSEVSIMTQGRSVNGQHAIVNFCISVRKRNINDKKEMSKR
jgi:hypothetical protein